ncbi:hypothetical protein MHK_001950 [Candidatus Magnetomorum sp. HK-1]|nr:hypothetical protein MHK_001950 [Candidatus Magnetomorum sp. HK-1]
MVKTRSVFTVRLMQILYFFHTYYLAPILFLSNRILIKDIIFKVYTIKKKNVQLEKAKICDSQIFSLLIKKLHKFKLLLKNENKHAGAFFAKTCSKQLIVNEIKYLISFSDS